MLRRISLLAFVACGLFSLCGTGLPRNAVTSTSALAAPPRPETVLTQESKADEGFWKADPKSVRVPGPLVDFVVVSDSEHHAQTFGEAFNEERHSAP